MCAAGAVPTEDHGLPATGLYQLLIRLPRAAEVEVGRLGRIRFPAGWYVYTGSARCGLPARIARHQRPHKRLRWHIDYLLAAARVRRIAVYGQDAGECALSSAAMRLPGAALIARGFGASDCACPAHLAHFRRLPQPWPLQGAISLVRADGRSGRC